ncbi:hypothetical protein [Polluticaenibacter yanchengensis]|uniref:CRISPR-associated protein Csh1 n=1 Tax=Polluticaenibacter yanchengensis TaxID=3014562 RepID=A0ABT4UPH8_9BACT|nr:hypothetical protein [Chitinophagaceae bacterium LY-5]
MIKELINFTKSIDSETAESSKNITNGVHIFIEQDDNEELFISNIFDSSEEIESEDLKKILVYEKYSAYLNMNKQQKFDKNQKIHSANPFSFAFNFSLGNNKKEIESTLKGKIDRKELNNSLKIESKNFKIEEVKKSINSYFNNAKRLCLQEPSKYANLLQKFEVFCNNNLFEFIKYGDVDNKIYLKRYVNIGEKDYVKVYLTCVSVNDWIEAYQYYFNSEYPKDKNVVNDFFAATYNQKKPFLIHQTASFDGFKFEGIDATIIKKFEGFAKTKPKILPNPLPIFIDKDELNKNVISIFKENGKFGYREIIESLLENNNDDLHNYYLLNWFYGKDFQVIDFDYVSKFEYEIKNLIIHNLFEIKEKGGKTDKHYPLIKNIFDFEFQVLRPLIQSKYHRVDFFGDLNKEDYAKLDLTFSSFSKYRKAVYDYVYKSQRNSIDGNTFYEMVFNSILDDVKNNNDYGIKEKLNIWYSLFNYFNPLKNIYMVNKLKEYQDFVRQLIDEEELTDITDEKFAFAAGQVIEYILSKSKSADNSFNLLEPYLQQSKCVEFKKAIANDFGRYKHENFSKNFEKVAAFVLSYETDANLKHLLPQILAGAFAKNQLFSSNSSK